MLAAETVEECRGNGISDQLKKIHPPPRAHLPERVRRRKGAFELEDIVQRQNEQNLARGEARSTEPCSWLQTQACFLEQDMDKGLVAVFRLPEISR